MCTRLTHDVFLIWSSVWTPIFTLLILYIQHVSPWSGHINFGHRTFAPPGYTSYLNRQVTLSNFTSKKIIINKDIPTRKHNIYIHKSLNILRNKYQWQNFSTKLTIHLHTNKTLKITIYYPFPGGKKERKGKKKKKKTLEDFKRIIGP